MRTTGTPAPLSVTNDEVRGAQALLKGLDILLVVGAGAGPMRFGEIERQVQMPRASLHRLLAALVSRSLIRYDARTRRYELGMRVLELSRRSLDRSEVIRAAKPQIARLARIMQRTICLMVADGQEVFVLDFEDFDQSYGRLVRLWPRQKLVESAAGRAILAAMPREDALKLIATGIGAGATPPRLLAEIDIGKALGYTVTARETATGKASAAAAIFDDHGFPIAAISCLFETDNVPMEKVHEAGRQLADASRRASHQIGIGPEIPVVAPRPARNADPRIEALPTGRDFVGENPIWDHRNSRLLWVDVLAPALRWWTPLTREGGRRDLQAVTAGLALASGGRMIACGQGGIYALDPETGAMTQLVDPEASTPDNRFNSAGVDPKGRFWACTMALNHAVGRGALYTIDASLQVLRHPVAVGMPKNPAFSGDGRFMYLPDAAAGCVRRYNVDESSARLSAETVLVTDDGAGGRPNGITVDADDHLWVTWLGGWAVRRYDPTGRLVQTIDLPVPMPTNCCFGGEDMSTLFITSTYIRMPPGMTAEAPAAGQIIAIRDAGRGLAQRHFFGSAH